MICPDCKTQMPDNAMYCANCGSNLISPKKNESTKTSNILLLWAVVYFLIAMTSFSYSFVMNVFQVRDHFFDWNWRIDQVVNMTFGFMELLSFLIIPFAIKKVPQKITVFILIGIIILTALGFDIFYILW